MTGEALQILVTGSHGLVGRALVARSRAAGWRVRGLDLRAEDEAERGDVRDAARVAEAIAGCDGVVHLAAVSRVVWAERDPQLCEETNVGGLQNVLEAALRSPGRPWVLFASSREVYGQAESLPVSEDAPLRPLNVYGRAKVAGEELVADAGRRGLRARTVRLSNVYGSTEDHADRVVPAFARAAVLGEPLRVDGADNCFDFTHIEDVTRGLRLLIEALASGSQERTPLQLSTGRGTTLGALAEEAIRASGSASEIVHAPPRDFDVSRFVGAAGRAERELGWKAQVMVPEGVRRLVADVRKIVRR
jgi:nucleoside-diphosphate-sugar epimerase